MSIHCVFWFGLICAVPSLVHSYIVYFGLGWYVQFFPLYTLTLCILVWVDMCSFFPCTLLHCVFWFGLICTVFSVVHSYSVYFGLGWYVQFLPLYTLTLCFWFGLICAVSSLVHSYIVYFGLGWYVQFLPLYTLTWCILVWVDMCSSFPCTLLHCVFWFGLICTVPSLVHSYIVYFGLGWYVQFLPLYTLTLCILVWINMYSSFPCTLLHCVFWFGLICAVHINSTSKGDPTQRRKSWC